ncbi:ribonucleoside-triphosphate reductase anaerobic [Lucifera butyrica]|uniref:Ribonucleoside-triphosphate reductase anaerobic n=1 Tax=Lucifera butyrica TaxID=1351585 RepID=A0A498RFU8_9FIRM|nr:anaerobic ribonucleoside-triphosphate reductase [Lucifera butyrica]VBB08952.1 ribonucleoside-triphosphate reductase anaerobic [Lucifera butyrica]
MMMIDGVLVEAAGGLSQEEARQYAEEEIERWQAEGKRLNRVVLRLDGNEVIVKAFEKSPIMRVRRITGYLSNINNFNDAKKAELYDRYKHMSDSQRAIREYAE